MTIYLKAGLIKGAVDVKGYENTIDIHYYDYSVKRSINQQSGTLKNRSCGLVNGHSLMLCKSIHTASTGLLQAFYQAQVIPEATFYHVSTGPEINCYMINRFYDVLITKVLESNFSDGVIETIVLTYIKHEKQNMPYDAQLKNTTPQTIGYDFGKSSLL